MTMIQTVRPDVDAHEALAVLCRAAENWCEYLDDNARESEAEPIDDAIATLRATAKGEGTDKPVVVCVEDASIGPECHVLGRSLPPVSVITVDLGRANLGDPGEFLAWAEGQFPDAYLPEGHPARDLITGIIDAQRARFHQDRWADLDSLRASVAALGMVS